MFRFLKLLGKNLAQGPSTDPFPAKEAHTPERFRGRVVVNPEQCVGCRICHHMCAGGAIRIEDNEEKTGYNFTVWHNTCALCGMCRHYCPTKAITLSTDWHNAHTQEDKYDWAAHYSIPYLACAGCGAHIRMLPPQLAARLYAHSPVDMTDLLKLCPSCRQLAAARREEISNDTHEQE
ncbi:4Fe-4S dicluster domain-containing protein [Desulfovibrio cuneatus]|uniref:4Fe-4S dicluster domain-containing protein n=1 Tax=Desulfovibrio cuneatus TaxID=159728 RepID=UPI0003FA7F21|nr:4Fe-4S dicluster domain-containing protein [Desulfovibrio cuneatus]